MFNITSGLALPDAEYLKYRIEQSVSNRGIRVDNNIFTLREQLKADTEDKLKYITSTYTISNPNSPKQLRDFMNEYFSEEALDMCRDREGKITTSKEKMADLAHNEQFKFESKFAIDLLSYRNVSKRLEALETILNNCDRCGIIKPQVTLGNTNRINYSKPALMNIPKALLWQVIRPYGDDSYLVSADIKNQEPWILINMLGIDELKQAIKSDSNGLYNAIYKIIYKKEPTEIERKECKTAWNALTYGSTKMGLKRICKNIDSDALYNYFTHIQELKDYRSKCYAMATNRVRQCETYFGTVLHPDARMKGQLQRQLMDFPIQGTGSDILSLLVEHIDTELEAKQLDSNISIYYSRHDEIIFEVSNNIRKEDAVKIIESLTKHQVDDWEPFNVEVKIIDNIAQKDIDSDDEIEL